MVVAVLALLGVWTLVSPEHEPREVVQSPVDGTASPARKSPETDAPDEVAATEAAVDISEMVTRNARELGITVSVRGTVEEERKAKRPKRRIRKKPVKKPTRTFRRFE